MVCTGEVTQRLYQALQADDLISARQVARPAIEAKGIPAVDSMTRRGIINRFTNVLYDLTRRGITAKIGHGPGLPNLRPTSRSGRDA